MKKLLLIVGITFVGVSAQATIHFTPSWFYMEYETDVGGAKSEEELTIYNLKLGKVFGSGLYIGGVYDMESVNKDDRTSLGLGLGYIRGGWNFHFTYFLKSDYEFQGGGELSGTGMNLEIGYVFDVGAWGIGPTLTYRKFTYDEDESGSLPEDHEHNRILPYLTFQFKF